MPVLTNPAIVPYVHWLNRNRKKSLKSQKVKMQYKVRKFKTMEWQL